MTNNLILVGIDETGYGAIAGPVTVCAVMVYPEWRPELEALNLRDSKSLSPERRLEIAEWISQRKACEWVIINEPAHVIDKVGPWDSVCKAARSAVIILSNKLGFEGDLDKFEILMDGKFPIKGMPRGVVNRCRVGADEKVLECKIASILAKVHRDFHMEQLSRNYPVYEWQYNKGYSSNQHLEALYHYGPMQEHRMTAGVWRAVKNHWVKNYRSWGQPMPHWLAAMNPRFAKSQQQFLRKGQNQSDGIQTEHTRGTESSTTDSSNL